jgi:transcriptional regulator
MLVGIEIVITKVVAKLKASQNQPEENRLGVVAGLRKSSRAADKDMADLVEKAKPSAGQ